MTKNIKEPIPKKIHYCWFGGKELTPEAKKCISSWKKNCPDYEIIKWDESTYDYKKNDYTKQAFRKKKWAFLSDYARLDIIYSEGGIYLDTDVELIKPLDQLLRNECYFGMEQPGKIATGLGFGAVKGHRIIAENKRFYENNDNVINKNGNIKETTCVKITTNILNKYGLDNNNKVQKFNDFTIYPTEYFCPKRIGTNRISITENTYSIHHYDASWKSNYRIIRKIKYRAIPAKQIIKRIIIRDINA